MFKFIKKSFFTGMAFFSYNVLNVHSLECVSMSNQNCNIRSEIVDVNSNEPSFYPYSIKINKCKGSCNSINALHVKSCVADVVKNINVKVFKYLSI